MFDHRSWINRAVSFTGSLQLLSDSFDELKYDASVKRPLTENELNIIDSGIDQSVPNELALFWLNGSRHCSCSYYCGIAKPAMLLRTKSVFGHQGALYGGASFYDAAELPDYLYALREWAEETWIAEYPEQKNLWLNSIPFAGMRNGDYLALDTADGRDDPPVIYLSHDDDSKIIAGSFTGFLNVWEALCYIGPEIWMLGVFQDENGLVDSKSNRAAELRSIFGLN